MRAVFKWVRDTENFHVYEARDSLCHNAIVRIYLPLGMADLHRDAEMIVPRLS